MIELTPNLLFFIGLWTIGAAILFCILWILLTVIFHWDSDTLSGLIFITIFIGLAVLALCWIGAIILAIINALN